MAIQTTLFESFNFKKMSFEEDSQLYSLEGEITEFGKISATEILLHYSEVNQLFNHLLKRTESQFLYNCMDCFETPEGKYYEMNIEKKLGYSLSIDMEFMRSLSRMKRCA